MAETLRGRILKTYFTKENLFLVALFAFAFFLRWYKLPHDLFFGFEQGRDALQAMSIFRLEDFVLVGPKTDIAGIFHGAWYYYLISIPYGLSGGNPLAAAFFIVALSSFVPVVMYKLLKLVTKSTFAAVTAGLLTAISFEFITFARWLSNVTPAVLFVALAFYCLWKYKQVQKGIFFVGYVTFAVFASQFQFILILWFVFLTIVLLVTRFIPLPKPIYQLHSLASSVVLYTPLLLFNLRNEFIMVKSVFSYFSGSHNHERSFHLLDSLANYSKQLLRLTESSLLFPNPVLLSIVICFLVGGSIFLLSKRHTRDQVLFFLCWIFMSLPALLFTESLSMAQIYVGMGLGVIGLFSLIVFQLWKKFPRHAVALGVGVFLLVVAVSSFYSLHTHRNLFFITIQDDLNLFDQRNLLQFVYRDAENQPYRLVAYTIPYLQPEAWQYLHGYYNPTASHQDAQLIYVVIESNVDPFWQDRWTEELGPTSLIDTQSFGKMRLEKRLITE